MRLARAQSVGIERRHRLAQFVALGWPRLRQLVGKDGDESSVPLGRDASRSARTLRARLTTEAGSPASFATWMP